MVSIGRDAGSLSCRTALAPPRNSLRFSSNSYFCSPKCLYFTLGLSLCLLDALSALFALIVSKNGEFLPARWCSRLPTSLAPPPESDMAYLSLLFLPFQMFPFRVGSGLHLLDMLIFHGRSRSPSCRCVADVVPAECSGGLPLRFLDRIDLEYLLLLIVYIQIVSLLTLLYLSLF